MFGASPRASINLILTARALAFVRGRDYVLPQDVLDMALDVIRHRLVLSYEALSDNVTGDDLLKKILNRIPVPEVPLHEHANASAPTPERILQRLDWQVIRRLDGLLQGDYRSLFYGYGVDFADLREYQPEDDIRYIDWNVTARMDTPYVRQYVEDREITAWFLLDLSPSVDFGTVRDTQKRTVLIDFVTTVRAPADPSRQPRRRDLLRQPHRAHHSGARRAQSGAAPGQRSAQAAATCRSAPFTDLTPLLEGGLNAIKRRSLVFIISDFISEPGWERPLSLLNQRHEVLAMRLWDPREIELPDIGLIIMEDAETGEQLYVDTHDRRFRQRFAAGGAAARSRPGAGLQARRRGCAVALDRRRFGARDRALRHLAAAAEKVDLDAYDIYLAADAPIAAADPAVRAGVSAHAAAAAAACSRSYGSLGFVARRVWAQPGVRRHIPPLFFLLALAILIVALARPQTDRQPAAHRRHGDPRLRRFRQHGRRRFEADPHGSGESRRAGFRRAPAAHRADRRRRLQRQRLLRADADQRPGRRPGRDQPPDAAARHVAGKRHPGFAQRDCSRQRTADQLLQQPDARHPPLRRRPCRKARIRRA